jgi:diguanylate cyclase (GGDEF)-like protein
MVPPPTLSADKRSATLAFLRPVPTANDEGFHGAGAVSHFGGKSEAEFRAWFYTSHVERAQISLGLAQLLVFISVGVDLLNADEPGERMAALLKLMMISPLLLATLWIARRPSLRHLFPNFMCASIIAVGAAFSLINISAGGVGIELRYDALVLVTVFTYFLGGLASVFACATGLALLGIHIFLSASKGVTLHQLAYESLFLLAVNAVGMLSANLTEQSVREAFWRFRTMTELSELDALTQLMNRRGFDRVYAELWQRAQREHKPLALAFVDVDHFKNINDRYGHEAGDQALKNVARVLGQDSDPPPSLCARLGGDELVAIWYDIDRPRAELLGARIPRCVEALRFRNEGTGPGVLTVSVGLAFVQPDLSALGGDFLRRADHALYEAKQQGRNRLAIA